MQLPLGAIINGFDVFLLVFVRMTGLFVVAPVFGRRNIPSILKAGFSFMLALILVNTISITDLQYATIWEYTVLIFREFIVGIAIGYVSYLVFNAIYLAGQFIDMVIGFGMVNVLDPMTNIQVPITANYYFILSMLSFFAIRGHHTLIRALFDSYKSISIGKATLGESLMEDMLRLFGDMFSTGFRIAAPVVAAMIIADVALGVISKTIPQMNVFVVGMPMKILLGIVIMMVTIPMFIMLVGKLNDVMTAETLKFIKDMGTG